MSYWTYRINRKSPNGEQWEHCAFHFSSEREAFLAVVRALDTEYPDQWQLNGGFQIVLKNSLPGTSVLALVDEHLDEVERIQQEIELLQRQLLRAQTDLTRLRMRGRR